jgi:hypothetical protein
MPTPRATDVVPLDGYLLLVTFDNGERRVYDANPLIRGDWFGQLRDPTLFATVHVAGLSVEWAGGQDVCPDELYHASAPVL